VTITFETAPFIKEYNNPNIGSAEIRSFFENVMGQRPTFGLNIA
jgi:hypothetical protein